MSYQQITISLPDTLFIRLQQAAQATQQSLPDVMLRALQLGSPPSWSDAPANLQADIAALDRLDDDSLWQIARARTSENDMVRYETLLDKNAENQLSDHEERELQKLRRKADRFMLRKAHAVALLQWRGHTIPPANKL